MAIDSPVDAVEKQFLGPSEDSTGLVLNVIGLAVPHLEPLLKFVELIRDHLSTEERKQRAQAFLDLLRCQEKILDALGERYDRLSVRVDDLSEAVLVAVQRDYEAFNDRKRNRYLKILGNAVRSEDGIEDLASFIRDVELLGDKDIAVLKVLNAVMNKAGDWTRQGQQQARLHPNTFIDRRQDLAVQIAQALRQPTSWQFSHEEGYSTCARLQGFGLAHEITVSSREVPVGEYCFRPSKRGLMLLKLLGESVENWQNYFPRGEQIGDEGPPPPPTA